MRPRSILMRSLVAVTLVVLVFVGLTGAYVYHRAEQESLVAADERLASMGLALARAEVAVSMPRMLTLSPEAFEKRLNNMTRKKRESHYRGWNLSDQRHYIEKGETVYIRQNTQQGRAVSVRLTRDLHAGFSDRKIKGQMHRVFTIFLPKGRYSAVSEPIQVREAAAKEAARDAIVAQLVLLPFLLLVLAGVLHRSLMPLKRLSEQLQHREKGHLDPLPTENVAVELGGFVQSVNELLGKIQKLRTQETRFIADAAHELRTPLTALMLQAEQLGQSQDLTVKDRQTLQALQEGLQRSKHQLTQLLHLSRLQADEIERNRDKEPEHFDLSQLLAQILETLLPEIEYKHLVLDIQGLDYFEHLPFSENAMHGILRNLLENAVRYSPCQAQLRVEFAKEHEAFVLSVINEGESIDPSQRERLFEPFVRGKETGANGTGLGLAIVKRCAQQMNAQVQIDRAFEADPGGVKVTVTVPWING